jgi:hypothetical protein
VDRLPHARSRHGAGNPSPRQMGKRARSTAQSAPRAGELAHHAHQRAGLGAQPAHRQGVQRAVLPQDPRARGAGREPSGALLLPARWRAPLEPPVRLARFHPIPMCHPQGSGGADGGSFLGAAHAARRREFPLCHQGLWPRGTRDVVVSPARHLHRRRPARSPRHRGAGGPAQRVRRRHRRQNLSGKRRLHGRGAIRGHGAAAASLASGAPEVGPRAALSQRAFGAHARRRARAASRGGL